METLSVKSIHIGRGGQPLMLHGRAHAELVGAWEAIIALAEVMGPKGRTAIQPVLSRLGALSGGEPAHNTSASPPPPAMPAPEEERRARAKEERELTRISLDIAKAHQAKRDEIAAKAKDIGGRGW